MKMLASYMLYYTGHLVSVLLHFDCFSWLYPVYNKLMIMSNKLDIHCKLWKTPGV